MDCLTFLAKPPGNTYPVYVLCGDEDFLKRQAVTALRSRIVGDDANSMALSVYEGDTASLAKVFEDLETLPFLSPLRLVIVENADPFVTLHRAKLEAYIGKPAAKGILALVVKTWPANTRLAKLVDHNATIVCNTPKEYQLPDWCQKRAHSEYGKNLASGAAHFLVSLVGEDLGLLDQELAKVASYVGERKAIEEKDIDVMVGHSRQETIFKIFNAIGAGNTKEALTCLARGLDQGDDPMKILGAMSWQLRRLAKASSLAGPRFPMGLALKEVGVNYPSAMREAEIQLRHLGSKRVKQLFDWLLETDQALKGGSELPGRLILERLVIRLSQPA